MSTWATDPAPLRRLVLRGVGWLAVAAVLGGLVLYAVTTSSVRDSSDAQARRSADQVADLVAAGRLPVVLPVEGGQVVQVLDASQRVLAASVTADRLTPLVSAAEAARVAQGAAVTVPGSRAALGGSLRVVGRQVSGVPSAVTPDGTALVVVATPTAGLDTTGEVLSRWLAVLLPVAVLGLALLVWRVAGASLRPVALARRSQRQFVADAAHELRSPLAGIRTRLEVAEHLGEGGDLPRELLPEVDRLSRLVEDLLTLARTGTVPDDAVPVRLGSLLEDLVRARVGSRVPVEVHADPALTVSAVPADLRRALDNLLDNAVRHARHRVRLTATAPGPGRTVRIVVTDDGLGIAPADRERAFERFTRLDEARDRDRGGSGLGLAIARELVRRNGGELVLTDAEPGTGTGPDVDPPGTDRDPERDTSAGALAGSAPSGGQGLSAVITLPAARATGS